MRIRSTSFLLALILSVIPLDGTVTAQSLAKDDPRLARVDAIFAQWNKPDSPGCAVAANKNGERSFERAYGMANLEYDVPMTPGTISETGSVAKQFTAAAIVLLAEKGKLSLDDPVRKYLPEVPDFGKPITIRHLINHTSGLRDQNEFFALMGLPMGRSVHTNDEILEIVTGQKRLNFDPGSEYLYSNTGYTLLVHIVARVSGRTFAEFTTEEFFKPLGMSRTEWRDDHAKVVKSRATAYSLDSRTGFRQEMPFGHVHGAGGLLTTVGDLLIWNENLKTGKVGGANLVKQLQTRSRLNSGFEIEYALGLTVTEHRGIKEVSHGGATAGYRTFLARYPEQDLSVALLCNVANVVTARAAREVAELFLDGMIAADPPMPVDVDVKALKELQGTYRDVGSGEVLRFIENGGKLRIGPGTGAELLPIANDRFTSTVGSAVFVFSNEGGTKRVTRTGTPLPDVTYEAVPDFLPTVEGLSEFVGRYYSDELNTEHTVIVRDGRLWFRVKPMAEVPLTPYFTDAFRLGNGGQYFRFTRDASGKINGYEAYTGRIRHLSFVRRWGSGATDLYQ
jgi:CubicO group peptidase (beta-lactamase class C family)